MGTWYSLVNQSRQESMDFVHIATSTKREIAGSSVAAAMVCWYLFEHPGDRIAFVSYEDNNWPFPEGSPDDLRHYREVTDEVVEALLGSGILQDEGREVFDGDDPETYVRRLRNIWDSPPPLDAQYPPLPRMPCAGCGRLLADEAECPACNSEAIQCTQFVPPVQAHQSRLENKVVHLGRADLWLGWLITLTFGGTALWSSWNDGRVPSLPGLRPLAVHVDLVWIYFAGCAVVMLVLTGRGIGRNALLMLAGACASGAMLSTLVFFPFFGLFFMAKRLYDCAVQGRE